MIKTADAMQAPAPAGKQGSTPTPLRTGPFRYLWTDTFWSDKSKPDPEQSILVSSALWWLAQVIGDTRAARRSSETFQTPA